MGMNFYSGDFTGCGSQHSLVHLNGLLDFVHCRGLFSCRLELHLSRNHLQLGKRWFLSCFSMVSFFHCFARYFH